METKIYIIETGREAVSDRKGAFHVANEIYWNADGIEAQVNFLALRNLSKQVKVYIQTILDNWNIIYHKKYNGKLYFYTV